MANAGVKKARQINEFMGHFRGSLVCLYIMAIGHLSGLVWWGKCSPRAFGFKSFRVSPGANWSPHTHSHFPILRG